MKEQSALGGRVISRQPNYNHTKIGRVTSVKDFQKYGRIEVIFLDYSQPAPVWVFNNIDREPVEGDHVLVGFIEGRKDTPYVIGFLKNMSYTTNFVVVKKDMIRLQLPVFDIGVKNGRAHKDVQEHLLNEGKKNERAIVELTPSHLLLQFPTGGSPVTLKLSASGIEASHPIYVR